MKLLRKLAMAASVCLVPHLAWGQSGQAPLEKVSLRFGFYATGIDSFWTYGRELGFFRQAGIEVEFREGRGSAVTAQTVAAGTDDFGGDVDGGTFLHLAAKGLPATAILASAAKSPLVILSPATKPLKHPQDLVAKQIAITSGDGPSSLLPALFKRNDVDQSKVTLINMQPGVKATSLLTGTVDGVATVYSQVATLQTKGLQVHSMLYADFGVVTPGTYLIVSNAMYKSKPDLVKRFVEAAQKSLQATLTNPEAAVESFGRVYPNYGKEAALGETKLLIDLFFSASTQGKAFGTVSIDDARAGAEVLSVVGMMDPGVDVSKFVTNEFISADIK